MSVEAEMDSDYDPLQAAVVAVNDTAADLDELASEDGDLLVFLQEVCKNLVDAKHVLNTLSGNAARGKKSRQAEGSSSAAMSEEDEGSHANNSDSDNGDGEGDGAFVDMDSLDDDAQAYIKFLKYISTHSDVSAFEAEKLTSTVSVYTARRCLELLLQGSERRSSAILEAVLPSSTGQPEAPRSSSTAAHAQRGSTASLPQGSSNEKLVKDMLMIVHSRQCSADECDHKYCANMKTFLAEADTMTWEEATEKSGDYLYLKQLEKHFSKCRKDTCFYCSTVNDALEAQELLRPRFSSNDSINSSTSGSSATNTNSTTSANSKSTRVRANRSVSMPPRPNQVTMQMQMQQVQQQMLQQQQQQQMVSAPFAYNMGSAWASQQPQYPMPYYQQMTPAPLYSGQQYNMMMQPQGMMMAQPQQHPSVPVTSYVSGTLQQSPVAAKHASSTLVNGSSKSTKARKAAGKQKTAGSAKSKTTRKTRMKAFSTPIKPTGIMEEEDDE